MINMAKIRKDTVPQVGEDVEQLELNSAGGKRKWKTNGQL